MIERNNLKNFKEVNCMAPKGGIVFLGSDYFSLLPVQELATVFHIDEPIFNRSICGATAKSISSCLDDCIYSLKPRRIFLNFGEVEEKICMNLSEFISAYEWLLYTLHNRTKAKIYVTSVMSDSDLAKNMNNALSDLCAEVGCHYIDITSALKSAQPTINVFNILKYYIHTAPLGFADVMLIE